MGPKKFVAKPAATNATASRHEFMLTHVTTGGLNNFAEFKQDLSAQLEGTYGDDGLFIRTGKFPQPKAPEKPFPSFTEANDPDGVLKALYLDEYKQYKKELHDLKDLWVQISATMWDRFSLPSRAAICAFKLAPGASPITTTFDLQGKAVSVEFAEVSYSAYLLTMNPHLLWILAERTHMGSLSGSVVGDMVSALKRWAQIVQGSEESTDKYKTRFDDALVAVETSGISMASFTEQLRAGMYVDGLDNRRYAQLKSELANHEAMGLSTRPANPTDAHALALRRTAVVTKPNGPAAEAPTANVFVTRADTSTTKRGGRKGKGGGRDSGAGDGASGGHGAGGRGGGAGGGGAKGGKKGGLTCILCDEPHKVFECPLRDAARAAIGKGNAVVNTATVVHDADPNFWVMCLRDRGPDDSYVSFMERVLAASTGLPADSVILDSGANTHLFRTESLLAYIRAAATPITITGVGGSMRVTKVGDFGQFGEVYLSNSATVNVLSLHQVSKRFRTDFLGESGFLVHLPSGAVHFNLRNGLYVLEMPTKTVMVQTVEQREALCTKREVGDARLAVDLLRRMAFPGSVPVKKMIEAMHIMNCPVGKDDLRRATFIYGPNIPSLKGKTKQRAAEIVKLELLSPPPEAQRDQALHTDIMFVDGEPFLIVVSVPLGMVSARFLKTRTASSLIEALTDIIQAHNVRGFRPSALLSDGEGGVAKIKSALAALNVQYNPTGAGQHVPVVENMIRQIKERMRAVISALPFRLFPVLLRWLVSFCVSCINMTPSTTRVDPTSARELFLGRKVDYKRDLALGFGDYVQVHQENIIRNSLEPRTEGAIALMGAGNLQGSWRFYCLGTKRVVTRDRWTALPMPREVIAHLNELADLNKSGIKSRDPVVYRGATIIEDAEEQEVVPVPFELPARAEQLPAAAVDPNIDAAQAPLPPEPEVAISKPGSSSAEERMPFRSAPQQVELQPHEDSMQASSEAPHQGMEAVPELSETGEFAAQDVVQEAPAAPASAAPEPRYPVRGNRTTWREHHKYAFNISVAKALKTFGTKAEEAIFAELQQMLDLKVWILEDPSKLTSAEIRAAIFSSMFLKEKFKPDGSFDKLKARLVANGNQQDRTLYDPHKSVSSPTVALKSVFLGAGIAAAERRHVITMDIIGAYLKIDMTGQTVRVRLPAAVTSLLCKLRPEYKKHCLRDGTVVVRLLKAMYGCLQSGRLLFNHVSATLQGMGFKQNPMDPCVFNKGPLPEQCTVHVYVDDLFITCARKDIAEGVVSALTGVYGTVKVQRGVKHAYLGMTLDFARAGSCKVTMGGYIDEVLRIYSVTGNAATPATRTLLDIPKHSKELDQATRVEFHSAVARLPFLAKRARPDLLLTVAILSTRVSKATEEDQAKLARLLKYLNGTKHMGMVLCFDRGMLQAGYIDVAFGVHWDGKSHTGSVETVGKGPISASSGKQTLVTKSSTEGELVGVSDKVSDVVQTREYLIGQGYKMGPATVYQDNMSTIAMIKNGRASSERTRHINIRYFFIKDRADAGEIEVVYKPTKEMIADILTKPLQGELFRYLRGLLLNWTEAD